MKVVTFVASNGITFKYWVEKGSFYYIELPKTDENPSTMKLKSKIF